MEWRKISKKTMLLLGGLFVLQVFFFLYSVEMENRRNDQWQFEEAEYDEENYRAERLEYVKNYRSGIEEVIKQADSLGGISIFAKKDSFSESNLQKTKSDFERILNVEPVAFDDIFLKEFFSYDAINGFVLLGIMFVAFALVEEKKQGLRSIIYSGKNGRGRLVLQKISALFLWTVIIVMTFYGGNLIVSAIRFQGNLVGVTDYPIQSMEMFSDFTWDLSIGEFLIWYLIYKVLMVFAISLVVWLIMFMVDNVIISGGIIGALGCLMYISYYFISPNSPYNYLRYCNFWYLMSDMSFFTEYKNLSINSEAVNKDTVIFVAYGVFVMIILSVSMIIGIKRYPCRSRHGKTRKKAFIMSLPEKLSAGGMEFYKILVKQKGIVVLIVLFATMINQTDLSEVRRSAAQELYYDFMEKYEGVPGDESEQYISEMSEMLSDIEKEYEQAAIDYEAGRITEEQLMMCTMRYHTFESERIFMSQIKEQKDYIELQKTERDIDGWYINMYGYNHLFTTGDTMGNIVLIFAVVLLCSGVFSYEKKSGTLFIVRGSMDGRSKVFSMKMRAAVVVTLVMSAVSTVIEIVSISYVYGLSGFAAPVQSVYMLEFVPFKCSIGVFVVGMYLLKALVLVGMAVFVCAVSMTVNQRKTIIVSFILCAPALLSVMGFAGFENYSVVSVMSIGPLLLKVKSIAVVGVVGVAIIAVGIMSLVRGYRKWCIT